MVTSIVVVTLERTKPPLEIDFFEVSSEKEGNPSARAAGYRKATARIWRFLSF